VLQPFSQRKGGAHIVIGKQTLQQSWIVDGSMVDRGGGGGCCLVTKRKQGKGIDAESEGAYGIWSLMALMLVNKHALFIFYTCINKMCIGAVKP